MKRISFGAWIALGLMLTGLGFLAGSRLPFGLYPELTYPRVVIVASLPGQPAATFDLTVTRPMAAEISTIPGVTRVRARSIRGGSELSVSFDPGADIEAGFQRLNARLASLGAELPAGVTFTAERITAASLPVVNLALIGSPSERQSTAGLRDFALYELRPKLAQLPGVGQIAVVGGDDREIEVEADADRLAETQLSMVDLGQKLKDALPLTAAGRLAVGPRDRAVVVRGLLDGPAALEPLAIAGGGESTLRLEDVAEVTEGHADRTQLVSAQGQPGVVVSVGRRYGADAVALSRSIAALVAQEKPALPEGAQILTTYDQADLIAPAVAGVRDAIALGALLAILVLAAFLRNLPATLIGASVLPFTLALTLLALAATHQTLNLMSLGGLAVAIGLLVDDAVVVLESIERRLALGQPTSQAASEGVREVRAAVITSTLATVVVLLPLIGLSGVAGQFLRALAFTLGTAVLVSLATALWAIPILARRLRPRRAWRDAGVGLYRRSLGWALGRIPLVLGAAALLLLLGIFAGGRLTSSFLPNMDEGSYVIDYLAPPGTNLAESNQLARKIDDLLRASPFVSAFSRRLGSELGPPTVTQPYSGDVAVRLRPDHPPFEDIAAAQRVALAGMAPQLHVEFMQVIEDNLHDLEGQPEPIEVKLFGPDPEALRHASQTLGQRLSALPEVVDLYDGDPGCAPEVNVDVDAAGAGATGLTSQAIADQVRTDLSGEMVGSEPGLGAFADRLIPVRLRLRDEDRFGAGTLDRLLLATPSGRPTPLGAVAKLSLRCPSAEVRSENLRRMVALTARLQGGDLGKLSRDVRSQVDQLALPPGTRVEIGGQALSQRAAFSELTVALILATLGLFAILVFHFGSLDLALVQLAAVPIAMASGALALFVAGVPFNISSGLGFLVLAGLVVKNGVLLLDQAETRRRDGATASAALREAAASRLRPIAMTTLATLLGLLPLALGIGAGSDVQRPLAVVVLGGLGLSSLVTLYAVPALYLLLRRSAADA